MEPLQPGDPAPVDLAEYGQVLGDIVELLDRSRAAAARRINQVLTATYWQIGRRIVEVELAGSPRAAYGDALIRRLSIDLTERFGRGFSARNLHQFRNFYLT